MSLKIEKTKIIFAFRSQFQPSGLVIKEKNQELFKLRVIYKFKIVNQDVDGKNFQSCSFRER